MAPKSDRSALYFFADEYRRKTDRRLNIREAIELCYPQWKIMSAEQKEIYNNMYRKYKEDVKNGKIRGPGGSDGRRQNCLGLPMSETRDRLEELLDRKNQEMNYLQARLDLPLEELIRTEFLIVSYQIFCETSDGVVLPAELSICRWSILDRIRDLLTITMRPTQIPSGYASDALEAEKIHGIPAIGRESRSLHDYSYAWNALNQFIRLRPRSELYVDSILFMVEDSIDKGLRALERIASESLSHCNPFVIGVPEKQPKIGLMSCESLFSTIWNASDRLPGEKEPSTADVRQIISSDIYAYDRGVCCEYHEALENINCTQNRLKHICFGMEKTLCPRFAFPAHAMMADDGDRRE